MVGLLFVISGCVGDASGAAGDGATADPVGPATVTAAGDGSFEGGTIEGLVVDDASMPIEAAQVALAELKVAAVTDAGGRFAIQNVPPGAHTLYAGKLGYDSHSRRVDVLPNEVTPLTITLAPLPAAEAYDETIIKALEILIGLSWSIFGDFNQGCISPGVTCQGVAVSTLQPLNGPNIEFPVKDPKESPLATFIVEEHWVANSAVCARAVQVGLYNPGPHSKASPSATNPHYWTNYPHPTFGITSPIWMKIPRYEADNPDSIDNETRIERNGDKELKVDGMWYLRNFPPGKGLTNQPVDFNCFTQQRMNIYWSNFYLSPAPERFTAIPS